MGSGSSKQSAEVTAVKATPAANFDLYVAYLSPNARSNLMLVGAMGIKPNIKVFDLQKGEHKTDEYARINPYQAVPSLTDGDFKVWESRAVMAYIANKFGGEKFYPKDPTTRAKVDMALYIDATTVQPKSLEILLPILTKTKTPDDIEEEKAAFTEVLKKLETNVLKDQQFFAGRNVTIGDFSICATIVTLELCGYQLDETPKLNAWMNRMKALPYVAEANKAIENAKKAFASS